MRAVRRARTQGALHDQLLEVTRVAVERGLHDAADFIGRFTERRVAGRPALTRGDYDDLRRRRLDADGWRCRNSRCRGDRGLTIDHIVQRGDGGPDDFDNLATLCVTCHDLKEKGVLVWRQHPATGAMFLLDRRIALDPPDPARWLEERGEPSDDMLARTIREYAVYVLVKCGLTG